MFHSRVSASRNRRLHLDTLECRLAPATLQGTVWQDLNANGVRDPGDPALAGRTVYLDTNGNRQFDAGESSLTSGADGSYSFTGLAAGTYAVVQALDAGWVHTSPRSGPVSPTNAASSAWKTIGPFGGDVVATAVAPGNSNIVLAAVDSETTTGHGGLYRSTDGGTTWNEISFFKDNEVHAVVYAVNGVAFAGTFSGLFKSTDDGATWTKSDIANENYQLVLAIGTHPTDPNILFVGLESGFGQQPKTIWKSTDGGATWTNATPGGSTNMAPSRIAFNPANPQQIAIAYGVGFGPFGVFTTTNGGASWQNSTGDLPGGPVFDVKFSGGDLYVAGGTPFFGNSFGVRRSTDFGQSWTSLSNSWPEGFARSIAIDPANPSILVAGTERDGVYRSTDGGATWAFHVAGTAGALVNEVRFVGSKVLASTGQFGVLASTDGGATFASSTAGISEFATTSVAVNPMNPSEMLLTYSGLNSGGVMRSTNGGATWNRESIGGSKFMLAKYSPNGTAYVAASVSNSAGREGLYRRASNGTWTAIGPDLIPGSLDSDVRALAFSPTDPSLIIAVGQNGPNGATSDLWYKASIWRTTDGGLNWTVAYVQAPNPYSTIINDVERLANSDVLIATLTDQSNQVPQVGGVLRSADNGVTWTFAGSGENGLPTKFNGSGVGTSTTDANKVYITNGNAFPASFTYLSTDGGQTWTGGAAPSFVSGMYEPVVDRFDDRIVYAREAGQRIVRTLDGGATWAPFDRGLDNAPWFYGQFALSYTMAPTPRLVVGTLAGIYSTELYSQTAAANSVTVQINDVRGNLDFGSRPLPGEISGSIIEDAIGDGQTLSGFPREDQVAYLDLNTNALLDSGEPAYRTNGFGTYRFTGLNPGTYSVRLLTRVDTLQTYPANNAAYTINLAADGNSSGNDLGFQFKPAVFQGTKYNDLNGNGTQDVGEPGLPGWTMFLDLNANGSPDTQEPQATTDVDGHFTLKARDPGPYVVSERPAPYWRTTSPTLGNSVYSGATGFEPSYGSWADRDPSTPNVTDLWYDFRDWNGYSNSISPEQQALVRTALDGWEQATGGKIRFTRNTTAPTADIITIGTGDLAALGLSSLPNGVLGAASFGSGGPSNMSSGVVWMDFAETWDLTIGNGQQSAYDYFSVALHEIGHSIGVAHTTGVPYTLPAVMSPNLFGEYTNLSVLDIDEVRKLYGANDTRPGFYLSQGVRGVVRDNLNFGDQSTGTPPYADLYLDFGVYFSTQPAGYSLVEYTQDYNVYTRTGWTSGADRYGWYSGFNDPLLEDYIDTADSTFAADLPTGTYEVTVTFGAQAGLTFDQMQVSFEGTPVDTVDAIGSTVTRTYVVSILDGQLTARFKDLGGATNKVAINAMTIKKVADRLTLSIAPSTFSETAGSNAATGTVTRTGDLSLPVTVNLSSNDTSEATVPTTVTIPAGQASATFPVTAVDDTIADLTQTVTISVSAVNYTSASTNVSVTDNEEFLTLSINPTTFSEAAGTNAATGTVTRSGSTVSALVVTLASSDTTEARVPATVTIPAGKSSVTFRVSAINDTILDGPQSVTITASAAGFFPNSAGVTVTDDERRTFTSAKFDFGTANSPVVSGFTRVHAGTIHNNFDGFGWSAGTISSVDRGSPANSVNRDFNATADGTFSVNVPNGTYSVTVTMGDHSIRRDRMQLYLEGSRRENNLNTSAGQFHKQTYSVRVSDGQLTVRIADNGGQDPLAVINALEFNRTGN